MGRYRSGQTGQTVNLLAFAFVGSNPTRPTKKYLRTRLSKYFIPRNEQGFCFRVAVNKSLMFAKNLWRAISNMLS